MTEMVVRGREVTRPEPEPLTSTILDHATVVDVPEGFGLRNDAGLWPSYNCLDTVVPTPMCPNPLLTELGEFKEFSVAPWVPAFEFAVHGGVRCALVGLDTDDQFSEIKRVFERNEALGVERAIKDLRLDHPSEPVGSDDPVGPWSGQWNAAPNLGTMPSLSVGLAVLESHAANHYAGVPTLHMPRGAVLAAFGAGLISERDGKFYTKTGAKIAAGGGYEGTSLIDALWSIYATGEVYVERSTRIEQRAVVLPGDGSGTGSDENGLGDNTGIALVERAYRVALDCYAMRVDVSLLPGGNSGGGEPSGL